MGVGWISWHFTPTPTKVAETTFLTVTWRPPPRPRKTSQVPTARNNKKKHHVPKWKIPRNFSPQPPSPSKIPFSRTGWCFDLKVFGSFDVAVIAWMFWVLCWICIFKGRNMCTWVAKPLVGDVPLAIYNLEGNILRVMDLKVDPGFSWNWLFPMRLLFLNWTRRQGNTKYRFSSRSGKDLAFT